MKIPQDTRRVQVTTTRSRKKVSKPLQKFSPLPVATPKRQVFGTLTAIAVLLGSITVVAGGIWLAILLMINPDAVSFLNRYFPGWTRIDLTTPNPPQTLAAIQSEIGKQGLIVGESLNLEDGILLPLLRVRPNCFNNCRQIVQLRVYQSSGNARYQLTSQMAISSLDSSFVLAPLGDTDQAEDSNRPLPLTTLTLMNSTEGIWLNLSGEVTQGKALAYGKIIHYNPSQNHLSFMLDWTSPTSPYWTEVTGGETPELVINQTIGLDPKFQVYQIQPRNFLPDPIYLEEISLSQPAINSPAYRNALMLSDSGLWTPAWERLQSLKQRPGWTTDAQAQLDVIKLHALVTQSQAKQAWASPSQQILALLIDGDWEEALAAFGTAATGATIQETIALLKVDSDPLWGRVEAELKVDPTDKNAIAWGAMLLTAQQGRDRAIAWLTKLPKITPATLTETNQHLDQLEAAEAEIRPVDPHFSQIIGTAKQVTQINPTDWLSPDNTPLPIDTSQTWYAIQVSTFNNGKQWANVPLTNFRLSTYTPGKQLWRLLGLDTDSQIQITTWIDGNPQVITTNVKAISYKNGFLQLLAVGDKLPKTDASQLTLAQTDSTIRWVETGSLTLSDLNQLQPQWAATLLPTLWRELQKARQLPAGNVPNIPTILKEIGYWTVQPIDLTGNNQPEAVLTVYQDVSGVLKKPATTTQAGRYRSKTLIFSDRGTLLYNEFGQDAPFLLKAIADLGDGDTPALLLEGKTNYTLKRWSSQQQKLN